MAWDIFGDFKNQVGYRECFSERYLMNQESEIVFGSLVIKTLTETRWDVRLQKIDEEAYYIELLTLDNVLLETNNPNMRDVSSLNSAFKKMYNELNFVVNRNGNLIKVINIVEIKRKWQQVKAEMQAIQTKHKSLQDIITFNDELFSQEDKITEAVKNNEFFELFFHRFMGINITGGSANAVKKSLFMQADISWRYNYVSTQDHSATNSKVIIKIDGFLNQPFDPNWLTKAYGQFPMTEAATLKPNITEKGNYLMDSNSGKILEASLQKEEVAHPQLLWAKIKFNIIADSFAAKNGVVKDFRYIASS